MSVALVPITPQHHGVDIALAYATADNFTGSPVYARAECFLHPEAADHLDRAVRLAEAIGYRLRIFDAYRPKEAQWVLWNHTPDPDFLADPRTGSPHSRGVAVDLTLIDQDNKPLDMGTAFDAFTPRSYHGALDIPPAAQLHRHILLGLMSAAGWDFYHREWWHYQLFDSRRFPLIADGEQSRPMMTSGKNATADKNTTSDQIISQA